MQNVGWVLYLSSTDLVGHLNCTYLTELDLKVVKGELQKPKVWDPVLETLAERGAAHEQAFIDHLKTLGLAVTVIYGVGLDPKSISATLEAMTRGDAVIVQGALQSGTWNGRADVLRRRGLSSVARSLPSGPLARFAMFQLTRRRSAAIAKAGARITGTVKRSSWIPPLEFGKSILN